MLVFLMTTIIIFGVNIYMYFNMNYMIGRIDNVYLSNTKLNDLQNSLTGIQTMMTEYLSTKSTDSAESYYEYESTYRKLLKDLNLTSTDNESL